MMLQREALESVKSIEVSGVTNMSAGIFAAISQFNVAFAKRSVHALVYTLAIYVTVTFCIFLCRADFKVRRRLRRLRSASSLSLCTVGDRDFPDAAAHTWNSLPKRVTSAPSMSVYRGRLKAFLFRR